MSVFTFSNILKSIAYICIAIALIYKLKDLKDDAKKDKHRDLVDILLIIIDIIFVHYTKIG
ncbi:hypothetical protein [Clostridium sp.]|uniref:hypothetical protein n=1 Tax=Clostridium sp. TaxID=1506 RepID=UPI0026146175|nr:hypothetical protein [Clostridium sp.]